VSKSLFRVPFGFSESFQAGIGKPGTQNPGPGQVLKLCYVPSKPQKNDVTMRRNRHIWTKFQENRQIFGTTKHKLFRNLAASHQTWNVTTCDENVTSHHFVTVPHSNPGPGSGKIAGRNDPHYQLPTTKKTSLMK